MGKNFKYKQKGITLIALVITIIVLLILASVSIAMLTGDNGILTQANKAKNETGEKGLKEEVNLMMQKRKIDEATGQKVALKEDLEKEISGNKVIEEIEEIAEAYYITKDNQTVTVYEDGTVAEGKAIWDGASKSKPTVDSEGNWHIKTPEEFKYFADFVNGKLSEEEKAGLSIGETTIVNLENHIDLGARQENGTKTRGTNWDSIGKTKEVMFSGIFEGNNNIIRGIYIDEIENCTGLFGRINEIKNLTIKDSYITGGTGIGGIVGLGNIVENCHNENTTVVLKEGNHWTIGGIVGQINNKIIKCSNTGTIIANGKNSDNGIIQCGGVIGASSSKNEIIISNCSNKGKITGKGNIVGGIVGNAQILTTTQECENTGTVTGEGENTGGIIGQNSGNIEKCQNKGKILGQKDRIGGITGGTGPDTIIKECENEGTITGEGNYVGGIAGICFGNIEKSKNQEMVIGKGERVGGITGGTGAKAISNIKNCYNAGEIMGKKDRTGGIIGCILIDATSATIKNNYNTGKVTGGTINAGGVIGENLFANTVIENNYYLKGTAESGNGAIKQDEIGKIEKKEEQEMKTEEFGNILNAGQEPAVWKGNNGAYPELMN